MRELITSAQARGDVPRGIDPALATATIMGSIAWLANWYRPGGRLSSGEIGRQQAALLIAALRHGAPDAPARKRAARGGLKRSPRR